MTKFQEPMTLCEILSEAFGIEVVSAVEVDVTTGEVIDTTNKKLEYFSDILFGKEFKES